MTPAPAGTLFMNRLSRALLLAWIFSSGLAAADPNGFLPYSTKGHPKAQGVNISLDHPSAWIARDNPQPGIVHEFRAPGTGGRDALIIVIPTVQPRKATPEDFRKSFAQAEAQKRIMPGAHHLRKAFIDDLAFPCVALDYDLAIPQLAPSVAQVRNYILLVGDKMVQIQFYGVAPPDQDLRVERGPMMEHVVRSIVKN